MKHLIIIVVAVLLTFFSCSAQKAITDYWLPLERLNSIKRNFQDSLYKALEFPIASIKFSGKETVWLLPYDYLDPFEFRVESTNSNTFLIRNPIIPLEEYEKLKKIEFKYLVDTLVVLSYFEDTTFTQLFVKMFDQVQFNDYEESDIGKIYLEGAYNIVDALGSMQFHKDGKVTVFSNVDSLNFSSFTFKLYARDYPLNEEDPHLEKIISLKDAKGKTKDYVISQSADGIISFHRILKMRDDWQVEKYIFSFKIRRKYHSR